MEWSIRIVYVVFIKGVVLERMKFCPFAKFALGAGSTERKFWETLDMRLVGMVLFGNGVRQGTPVGPIVVVFGSKISPA